MSRPKLTPNWTEQEKQKLTELYCNPLVKYREIATILVSYGFPLRSFDAIIQKISVLKGDGKINFNRYELGKEEFFNKSFSVLKVEGDSLVAGDLHIPYTDWDLLGKLIEIAKKFKIYELDLGGDILDQYGFACAIGFPPGDPAETFDKEIKEADKVFKILLTHFKQVNLIPGSHDKRILKVLKKQITLQNVYQMITNEIGKKVFLSETQYMIRNGIWRITHPKSYSRKTGAVAQVLAAKEQCNIISFHSHQVGLSFDISGKFYSIDAGGLFNDKYIAYIQEHDTTHPRWTGGFVMLKNNVPYLFTKRTDWGFYLKK